MKTYPVNPVEFNYNCQTSPSHIKLHNTKKHAGGGLSAPKKAVGARLSCLLQVWAPPWLLKYIIYEMPSRKEHPPPMELSVGYACRACRSQRMQSYGNNVFAIFAVKLKENRLVIYKQWQQWYVMIGTGHSYW